MCFLAHPATPRAYGHVPNKRELYAVVTETADELERAQKEQDHLRDEVDRSCEELALASRDFSECWTAHETMSAKLCSAFREVNSKRATHETTCVEARKAWQRTHDSKRKASEAQENLCHRERTRRISNDHARTKAQVNDSLGTLGEAVRAAAQATHSLTCGVPDRESNETKYLRVATELIEDM